MDQEIEKRSILSSPQKINLEKSYSDTARILDIGGGGEGIIGSIYGSNVVAIDKYAEELYETENESLKIIMDAANMSFIDKSFDAATLFYFFFYMTPDEKKAVLRECRRVLKKEGTLEICDISIPKYENGPKDIFIADLHIALPNHKKIDTKYGAMMREEAQDAEHIIRICEQARFKLTHSEVNNESFHLSFIKD